MTLHVPRRAAAQWYYDNFGTNPSATLGTSVTPGATNAEGSWTQIASSANIANDVVGFYIQVTGGATSAAAKNHLLDVGVDPAGGTSYTAVISNLQVGASPAMTAAGLVCHYFPLGIKAGSSVAVRVQGSNGTAGTVRVVARFYGKVSRPELMPVGRYSQTFGTITDSNGQSFTPGNAADGSWVDLGAVTTDKPLWWWQLGFSIDNGTITAEYTYIDLAWGDASNKRIISRMVHGGTTSEVAAFITANHMTPEECYWPVPAGANIYIRGRCNNAPDTGYHATVVGIGG